jgi:molecular chaperone GrpE
LSDTVKKEEVMDEAQETVETSEAEAQAAEETAADVAEETVEEAAEEETEKKDKKDEKIDELTDRLQRSMAEFDNYRKRTEKEKASMYMIGAKEVVEKILPVIDNFERAIASFTDADKETEFFKGVEMIYNQTKDAFIKLGVEEIKSLGEEFNPELHNAIMHIEDETVADNTIVEEFQKGYTYGGKVIRYSMVKVAN